VVALESTILAHGLPRGDNLRVGREIEAAVRAGGAVPATIAVLDGQVHVGLDDAALEQLCTSDDVLKLSVRDLGVAVGLGLTGATTVASTSALAHRVGIRVFATGGLGGVHRGASQTFDVSADLGVLASTPVLVVCAGVKSILDVSGTLEYLETLSVPVLGYRTLAFPGLLPVRLRVCRSVAGRLGRRGRGRAARARPAGHRLGRRRPGQPAPGRPPGRPRIA
jgi:pseudouridine-5'-phosphate glycosidase